MTIAATLAERHGLLVLLLVVAVAVRLAALIGHGFGGDIRAISSWAKDVAEWGLAGYYAHGGQSNYPPLLFVLWPIGELLHGSHVALAIRMLSIPFDLATGALLYWLLLPRGTRAAMLGASFYLLNPGLVAAGPLWGQIDSFGVLALIGCLAATSRRRYALAGALGAIALIAKTQFGLGLPILAAAIVLRPGPGKMRSGALAAGGVAVALAFVFVTLRLSPLRYMELVIRAADARHEGSIYAWNVWSLTQGFRSPEGAAFAVGAVAFAVAAVGSLALLRKRCDLSTLFAVGGLIALALYFLPTRVHERYLFGAVALLAPLAGLHPRLRVPFMALSMLFAGTLVYVLLWAGDFGTALEGVALPGALVSAGSIVILGVGAWCALECYRIASAGGAADEAGRPPPAVA